MTCDKYFELLSARLDGPLTVEEERELEAHLVACPGCQAAEARLAALRSGFAELEDIPAPEGFAQGVMDRIRKEKTVIPLFKRPQFRALAGLAACLVLAVGLYSTARLPRREADKGEFDLVTRGFSKSALSGDTENDLQIAAYSDSNALAGNAEYGAQKSVPNDTYDGAAAIPATPMVNTDILTLDRMPEGGWELISPETPVSSEGVFVSAELFEEIEQLAVEQGITTSITTSGEEAEEFVIVVLEEIE